MITVEEKRFVRYWEDQRKDGWLAYFLLYSLIGTIIVSLFAFIVLFFFLQVYISIFILIIVPAASYLFSCLLTIYSWRRNERRFRDLIRREINKGNDFFYN